MLENSPADATQLPTGCQPESLAKPARDHVRGLFRGLGRRRHRDRGGVLGAGVVMVLSGLAIWKPGQFRSGYEPILVALSYERACGRSRMYFRSPRSRKRDIALASDVRDDNGRGISAGRSRIVSPYHSRRRNIGVDRPAAVAILSH